MLARVLQQGQTVMAGLDLGTDIIESITALAEENGITNGTFYAIGALSQAELAYYDQQLHEYGRFAVDEPVEIASCTGNISLRDGRPFVHAHAVLSSSSYETMAGHLVRGTVFAAEIFLLELSGEPLVRSFDPGTGLYLWGCR